MKCPKCSKNVFQRYWQEKIENKWIVWSENKCTICAWKSKPEITTKDTFEWKFHQAEGKK